ncbi:MAG: DUF2628 domain-containing protein [Rickettsiales bacterium]
MNSYYILTKKDEQDIVLKDGFNFYCFFFSLFWALYKGLWSLAAIFFIIYIGSLYLSHNALLNFPYIFGIKIFINLVAAFYANDLEKNRLIADGYSFSAITVASDKELSYQRYLDQKSY